MNTNTQYAVYFEGSVIFGIGNTREEAIEDAAEWMDRDKEQLMAELEEYEYERNVDGKVYLAKCTDELYEYVQVRGGDCRYEKNDNEVLELTY